MYISSRFIIDICLHESKAEASDYDNEINVDTPKITPINADIDKSTYCDMNKRVVDYIINNNKAPSYVTSKYGNVQFQAHIYSNSKILNYYRDNDVLPNYVSLNLDKNNKILTYLPKFVMEPEDPKVGCGVGIKSLKSDNGKTKLDLYLYSSGTRNYEKVMNNVYKIVLEIEGYDPMTFKRPIEGWKIDEDFNKYKTQASFSIYFTVNGKPENLDYKKHYTVKLYDEENKLLFSDYNGLLASKY
jgi:hypothetical protein